MDDLTLVFTIISTTATTIFALAQVYLKLKQALHDSIKQIVKEENRNLEEQLNTVKAEQQRIKIDIDQIKKKLNID